MNWLEDSGYLNNAEEEIENRLHWISSSEDEDGDAHEKTQSYVFVINKHIKKLFMNCQI